MARLRAELLERGKAFSHRVMDVVEALDHSDGRRRHWDRVLDQLVGSGTSVGSNLREADKALSRKDFLKSLGIILKELGETRFWLEFVTERQWLPSKRLAPLLSEAGELSRVLSVMVARTKKADRAAGRPR